ncbi:ankyrin repeat-containing domain protein [Ochromonadaceae sp. CCMP2298]|nr:ankyrin repeat-containing domain protein [Ochromonadaceae sp. CCMP2298]
MEPGDDGYAVMHTACELDSTEMIEWLLKKGTPLNLRTTLGRKTPLMMALQYGSQEAVVLLLHYGAALHLDLVDAEGNTALHFAAIYSSTDCAMILLICGANSLSIRNKAGRLPGEEARARGRTEMAITILTYKSDNVDHLCRLQNLQTSQAHLQSDHRCRPQSAPAHGRSSDPLSDRGLSDDAIHPPRLVADAPISPSLLEGQMQEGQGQQTQARSRPQSASSMQGHGMGQGIGQGQGAKEEKKQLSRRMSSLIAERDPWNMGPVSKPLPRNMMKMSFYRKQVSSGTGLGAGAGAGFGGGAGSGTRRLNARAGARSDKSSSSNNSAGLLEKLA